MRRVVGQVVANGWAPSAGVAWNTHRGLLARGVVDERRLKVGGRLIYAFVLTMEGKRWAVDYYGGYQGCPHEDLTDRYPTTPRGGPGRR